jgi:hypothetical protein
MTTREIIERAAQLERQAADPQVKELAKLLLELARVLWKDGEP